MTAPRITRVTAAADVAAAAHLFDAPPRSDATARFLADDRHHLLLAYLGARPVGMITGVEMTHPDKGTEMFVYELGVADDARRQGIAVELVHALQQLAHERGCYGMWVAVDADNDPALQTYRSAGADPAEDACVLSWEWPR